MASYCNWPHLVTNQGLCSTHFTHLRCHQQCSAALLFVSVSGDLQTQGSRSRYFAPINPVLKMSTELTGAPIQRDSLCHRVDSFRPWVGQVMSRSHGHIFSFKFNQIHLAPTSAHHFTSCPTFSWEWNLEWPNCTSVGSWRQETCSLWIQNPYRKQVWWNTHCNF